MSTFVNAVKNQTARTTNGMKARKSTANSVTDLFYKIGASRGKNVIPDFTAAYVQDKELAGRVALWARDIRGGAGERKIFRDILEYACDHDPAYAERLLKRVPELGRWDDIFVTKGDLRQIAFAMVRDAIEGGVNAKYLLDQIDTMSEKECQKILDAYNVRNGVSS